MCYLRSWGEASKKTAFYLSICYDINMAAWLGTMHMFPVEHDVLNFLKPEKVSVSHDFTSYNFC